MSIVQSIIFNKHLNTINECYNWLKEHGFKTYKVDETQNYYRWRQVNPKRHRSYRIKTIDEKKQIKFVMEYDEPVQTYKHNYGRRV